LKQKKIIFVLPQLKTGGGVRVIIELSNILIKKYAVHFVLPNSQSECTFKVHKDITIEKIGDLPKNSLDKIKNIVKMFFYLNKRYKNEIVITTDPLFSPIFMLFNFKKLYRYIQADDYRIFDDLLLLKNRFFLTIYKFITKISYKQNIKYLFNSTFSYEQFIALKGKNVPKKIVHPSINHEIFHLLDLPRKSEGINLCLIARKHPMKRFEDFVKVYKEIKMLPHIRDKISNIYVISHDDLSQFDLSDFTMIIPKNDYQIVEALNRSDIYIFTSLWEGFGLPPLEAMSCGCAVIASDAKGIDEYAIDRENALIYPPMDTEALKEKLIRLVEDELLLKKLQKNGVETAQNFSWAKSAKQLETHLFKEDIYA